MYKPLIYNKDRYRFEITTIELNVPIFTEICQCNGNLLIGKKERKKEWLWRSRKANIQPGWTCRLSAVPFIGTIHCASSINVFERVRHSVSLRSIQRRHFSINQSPSEYRRLACIHHPEYVRVTREVILNGLAWAKCYWRARWAGYRRRGCYWHWPEFTCQAPQ